MKTIGSTVKSLHKKESLEFSSHISLDFHISVPELPTNPEIFKEFLIACEGALELGFHLHILGIGPTDFSHELLNLVPKYPEQLEVLEPSIKNRPNLLNKGHVMWFPVNPKTLFLQTIMKKGIVPIVGVGNNIMPFNPSKEKGEGFIFSETNRWQFISSLIRAADNHNFSYDWEILQQNCKKWLR